MEAPLIRSDHPTLQPRLQISIRAQSASGETIAIAIGLDRKLDFVSAILKMFVTPLWRKRVGQNVGLGVGVGRDKLYVSQSNYRKRNEGGQLRQCFLCGPTGVHSRPAAAKTWGPRHEERERERRDSAPVRSLQIQTR